jgi:hypothetical protein
MHCDDVSNIVTHHAEDGSGVGSAIIAGKSTTPSFRVMCSSDGLYSHDQNSKGCWFIRQCLGVSYCRVRADEHVYLYLLYE